MNPPLAGLFIFFELYAFIILTSTLVLGINYFLIITRCAIALNEQITGKLFCAHFKFYFVLFCVHAKNIFILILRSHVVW